MNPRRVASDDPFVQRIYPITGLTDGTRYTARVAARTYLTSDTNMVTSDAWSVPAPRVKVWSEPTQVWWLGTPTFATSITRVFTNIGTNKRFS